jgi:hypothetical protein
VFQLLEGRRLFAMEVDSVAGSNQSADAGVYETKLKDLDEVLKEVERLKELEDPEETPFVSKYKAIELLVRETYSL